jgi:hypothetical protein
LLAAIPRSRFAKSVPGKNLAARSGSINHAVRGRFSGDRFWECTLPALVLAVTVPAPIRRIGRRHVAQSALDIAQGLGAGRVKMENSAARHDSLLRASDAAGQDGEAGKVRATGEAGATGAAEPAAGAGIPVAATEGSRSGGAASPGGTRMAACGPIGPGVVPDRPLFMRS